MKKFFLFLFFIFLATKAFAETNDNLIKNLKKIKNFNFNFEQNINGKIETGNCTIEYPKKIFCKYDLNNNKILVSNGRSLVIKTSSSFYIYPLEKTSLNLILDKNFLLEKIINSDERIINDEFINYNFTENQNKINIFFDKDTLNLIGWQTLDIYQNLNITYLNSIIKNQILNKDLFKLPKKN
tara:strand:+ start:36 stop:584 length:549 start_codon:yes stop_codon:yes gene_type:complete